MTMTTTSKHWVRIDHNTIGSVAHARKAVEIQWSLTAGVVVMVVVMHAGKQAGHEAALRECGGLVNLKTVGRRK